MFRPPLVGFNLLSIVVSSQASRATSFSAGRNTSVLLRRRGTSQAGDARPGLFLPVGTGGKRTGKDASLTEQDFLPLRWVSRYLFFFSFFFYFLVFSLSLNPLKNPLFI